MKNDYSPEAIEKKNFYRQWTMTAANDACNQANIGREKWGVHNSAHEAYAVLLEEVDELWDHVKTKQDNRSLIEMRKEAIQVAAMALRFAVEVCDEERGRK
jgi:hypothetical protein